MYDYGVAPQADVVELTVFGPGYGEAIALHVGDGIWLLVDSCLSPQSRRPASLEYLDRLGVPRDSVRSIIASHWHDDHVKGLAEIVASCKHAELNISHVFDDDEAATFLAAYGGSAAAAYSAGAKELMACISAANTYFFASHRSTVWEGTVQGKLARAIALSPTQAATKLAVARFSQLLPAHTKSIKHIRELQPNLEAVALTVDLGDEALLLGSDLENHAELGWGALAGDPFTLTRRPASVYKVAHHGSKSGDHDLIWTSLLTAEPLAVLTPFNRGVSLPTAEDVRNITSKASEVYISSTGTKRPQLDFMLQRSMSAVATKLKPKNTAFGVVRFRKRRGEKAWTRELFGAAQKL